MFAYRVKHVRPLSGNRIQVAFSDGVRGRVDLSNLVGKGVFRAWRRPGFFEKVFVDEVSGAIAWPGGIDICPHTLHDELTSRSPGRPMRPRRRARATSKRGRAVSSR